MKGVIVAILVVAVASPAMAVYSRPQPQPQPQPVLARVTVYWASGGKGSDRFTRQHKCATGERLRDGHCAVDPKRIPYGSHVILPDGTRLAAVDTGTAVRNRKAARLLGKTQTERDAVVIDRFFETKRQALAWANSHPHFIPVRVITPTASQSQTTMAVTQPVSPPRSGFPKLATRTGTGPRGSFQLPKFH